MHDDDLFTAPQVARICSTDLKTIHNWVNRGEMKFFRTPGRHLRFRRADVVAFLRKFGYPVPPGFAATRPQVMIIDRDEKSLKPLQRSLSKDLEVSAYADALDALLVVNSQQPALILISGDDGADAWRVAGKLATGGPAWQVAIYGGAEDDPAASSPSAVRRIPDKEPRAVRRAVQELIGA
jgi:excisionase family DNA binding protein